jgi:hypothetical protein
VRVCVGVDEQKWYLSKVVVLAGWLERQSLVDCGHVSGAPAAKDDGGAMRHRHTREWLSRSKNKKVHAKLHFHSSIGLDIWNMFRPFESLPL